MIVAVYVDDLLITGSKVSMIEEFKKEMSQKFKMSDMGKLNYYLGIEVKEGDGVIELKQTGYAHKVLEKAGLSKCNPAKYPMDLKAQICKDEGGEPVNPTRYKSMIGGFDTWNSGNNNLTGFSDSDLAGNLDDQRSTGEFMATTSAACQGIWVQNVLMRITGEEMGPVILCVDNKSTIDLAKIPMFHGRSKHIDIRFHFIREYVERGEVVLRHVNSSEQRADIMTKALATFKFEKMRNLLGVKELSKHVTGISVVFVSALEGRLRIAVMDQVIDTYGKWCLRLITARLNRWLWKVMGTHSWKDSASQPKIKYFTQVKTRPPTFVAFVSGKKQLADSELRFLTRSLKEDFNLGGIPVRVMQ
ncbi:hypothetical protein AgCh_023188 [Apium graveolens]